MQNEIKQYYTALRVYPSTKGLHMEFENNDQAFAFYKDGASRGITYEIKENTVIKLFKTKKAHFKRWASS